MSTHASLGKIAIVGAGAVGLYYGSKLAQTGETVHFLLRSGAKEAREQGIRVSSTEGSWLLERPNLATHPSLIGGCDLIIIALKTTANTILPELLPPLLKERSALLTLQNGLGNEAFLAKHFPGHPILGGLCFVCLNRSSPATVQHIGHGLISLGSQFEEDNPLLARVAENFRKAGIPIEIVPSLGEARWRKLIWNIPFNGLTIVSGEKTVDFIITSPLWLEKCLGLMNEVRRIARADGFLIEEAYLNQQIERTKAMGPYRPSSLVDYQQGLPIELEAIWGRPLQLAEEKDVDTPLLRELYEGLQKADQNNPHRS